MFESINLVSMGMTVKLATQGTYSGHTLRSPFISSTNNCCVFYRMYMFIYFIQETLHFLFIWEKKNGLKSKFFCRVIFIKNTRHIGIMKTNMICTFVGNLFIVYIVNKYIYDKEENLKRNKGFGEDL